MDKVDKRSSPAVRGAVLVVAAAVLAGGLYILVTQSPTADSFYPKCVFYQATGLHCPGCGTGRAMHFLLNGDPATAVQFNILSVVLVPIIAVLSVYVLLCWSLGRPIPTMPFLSARTIWIIFGVLVVFAVFRNIPQYPFTQLAPQEIIADNKL